MLPRKSIMSGLPAAPLAADASSDGGKLMRLFTFFVFSCVHGRKSKKYSQHMHDINHHYLRSRVFFTVIQRTPFVRERQGSMAFRVHDTVIRHIPHMQHI